MLSPQHLCESFRTDFPMKFRNTPPNKNLTLQNFEDFVISEEEIRCFSKSLQEYLSEHPSKQPSQILANPYGRPHSWDDCYAFFQTNWKKLQNSKKDSEIYDIACLHLGFYFASFGMFRKHPSLMEYSKGIYRATLFEVFQTIKKNHYSSEQIPVCPRAIIDIDNTFLESLLDNLKKHGKKKSVSALLRQKFLLGVFGAIPAFDTNVKNHFKEFFAHELHFYPEWISGLSTKFSEKDIIRLCLLNKLLAQSDFVNDLEPKSLNHLIYPNARKLDLILWSKAD